MSASPVGRVEPLVDGLGRFLSEKWDRPARLSIDGFASTGARRRNVFISADDGLRSHRLVATIGPTAAIQIQDFLVEPQVVALAGQHGVPVAHVVGATTDLAYVGDPFFVTTRVDGETLPRRVLRLVGSHELGPRLVEQCGRAIAALHAIPIAAAPAGLVTETGDPALDAVSGLDEQLGELLQPSPVFSLALRWLEHNLPTHAVPPTIVHGDFRTGNIVVGDDGLRAVLDWEGVHTGDPMEDLAWPTMRMWRFGNDPLEVGGFALPSQLAAAYGRAGGQWDDERFAWWQVCGTLRWGIGLSHQARQHLDGTMPSVVMAASGRRVAEQEYDLLTLIRDHRRPQLRR